MQLNFHMQNKSKINLLQIFFKRINKIIPGLLGQSERVGNN